MRPHYPPDRGDRPYSGGFQVDSNRPAVEIVLAMRRHLDELALASLINQAPGLRVVDSTTSIDECVQLCCEHEPTVVVLDAGFSDGAAFDLAEMILRHNLQRGVLLLDDEVCPPRVTRALAIPRTSYYTRHARFLDIRNALYDLSEGRSSLDPALNGKISYGASGKNPKLRVDGPSTAQLSCQELRVMELLAKGHSVREIAGIMQRAPSTIDNHKSRLMKKLRVNKVVQLSRIAIKEGLVDLR